jgi:nicotinate-nucleotide adenylyltransferase
MSKIIIPQYDKDITDLPISSASNRIGLFGGSFNPPHIGHRMVSRQVMRRLNLDAIWWLVSPGNPLKNNSNLAPLAERVKKARDLITLPNVYVTGFEAKHGFSYSFESLKYLKSILPSRKFVWIMGSDNLKSFHEWQNWREIANLMPMAIYARPISNINAPFSKAAINLAKYRIDEQDAKILPTMPAPAWVYLHGIMSDLSSTKIRAKKSI